MGVSATSPTSSTTTGLVEAYDQPDLLLITPTAGLSVAGPVGGPFTPNPACFTLTNLGPSALSWTLVNTSAWMTVAPSSGTLTPGTATTTVSVAVGPAANGFALGTYPVTIWLTNQATGSSQSRVFSLSVVGRSMFDGFDPDIDLSQWSSFGGVLGSTVIATNYGGCVSPPNSLWFGAAGSRFATTRPIDTTSGGTISFDLRLANGSSSPWENVDIPDEGVVLEYSTDGGTNFTVAGTYDTATYYNWTTITLPIPAAAQSLATQFRWRQLSNSGTGYDHWALDDVAVDARPAPSILAQPASQMVPSGWNATFAILAGSSTPLAYQWQFNGINLADATTNALTLVNVQSNQAGAYTVVVSNAYSSITSAMATLTVLMPLGQAVDAPSLVWSSTGNAAWFSESSVTHDGLAAAQSGIITDSQSSSIQTSVTGPGSLSFWWKVSSEQWFDCLSFYIDGLQQAAISGAVDWQQQAFAVGSGSHALIWTYAKDPTVSVGMDAGWLGDVIFTTNPPVITLQPLTQKGIMGAAMALSGAASGAPPVTYQWLKDGTNLSGATSTNYVIAKATRRDSGVYQIVASNPGGGTPSSNATLQIRSPQKLGLPLPLPSGTITLTSKDADGGPLLPGDLPGFQAQATTNFMDWATLLNRLSVSNGFLLLVDPDSTNYSRRFYRILEP